MGKDEKDKPLEENTQALEGLKGWMSVLSKTLGAAGATGLLGLLGKTISQTNSLIKTSADLGIGLNTARSHFQGTTKALSNLSSEFGSLGMAMTLQRGGIDGNTLGITKLMAQERILTGSHEKVAEAMFHLRRVTGFTSTQLEHVANVVTKESDSRVVSTDALLAGMQALGESLKRATLLGEKNSMAQVEAMAMLSAKFPGMEKNISQAMDALTSSTSEGLMHVINAGNLANRTIAATSTKGVEVAAALVKSMSNVAERNERLQGSMGGFDRFMGLQIVETLLGPTAAAQVAAARAMRETTRVQLDAAKKAMLAEKTLTAAWEKFMSKVQSVLIPLSSKLLTKLNNFLESSGGWLQKTLTTIATGILDIAIFLLEQKEILVGILAAVVASNWKAVIAGILIGGVAKVLGMFGGADPNDPVTKLKAGRDALMLAMNSDTSKNTAKLVSIEQGRDSRERSRANLSGVQGLLSDAFSERFRNSDTRRTNTLIQTMIDQIDDLKRISKDKGGVR